MPRKNIIEDDDDDGGEGWLEQPNINYLPELDRLNETLKKDFSNTEIEKRTEKTWVIDQCIEKLWFKRTALLFGLTAVPLYESYKVQEKPIITASAPDTVLCNSHECKEHPPVPSYMPEEKTIHAPRSLADRIIRLAHSTIMPVHDVPRNEEVRILQEQLGRAFHHQKNQEVYRQQEPYSIKDIDSSTLVGCIGRMAQHHGLIPGEFQRFWKGRTPWLKRYARTVKETRPELVLQRARRNHDGYLMRYGFGYGIAHDILDLSDSARLGTWDVGDGGDCSWASVLRLILPAKSLKQAAGLLYEKANGPADCHAELWRSQRRLFYFEISQRFTGLRRFLYSRKPGAFKI